MTEKKRVAQEGTRFRLWWVLWKSFAFASGIGLFIWLFRRLGFACDVRTLRKYETPVPFPPYTAG